MDRMDTTELAANQFRMTQAREKLARDGVRTEQRAILTHEQVGREVLRRHPTDRRDTPGEHPARRAHQGGREAVKASQAEAGARRARCPGTPRCGRTSPGPRRREYRPRNDAANRRNPPATHPNQGKKGPERGGNGRGLRGPSSALRNHFLAMIPRPGPAAAVRPARRSAIRATSRAGPGADRRTRSDPTPSPQGHGTGGKVWLRPRSTSPRRPSVGPAIR